MSNLGTWLWSDRHFQQVRVEERLGLWGDEAIRIWLPQEDAIVRVRPSDLREMDSAGLLLSMDCVEAFSHSISAAIEQLKDIYLDLKHRHLNSVTLEEEKGAYSFRVRGKLLEGIGLPEVRNYRLRQLEKDKSEWRAKMQSQRDILPELSPILIPRVN
jgi:hypothetical protein